MLVRLLRYLIIDSLFSATAFAQEGGAQSVDQKSSLPVLKLRP